MADCISAHGEAVEEQWRSSGGAGEAAIVITRWLHCTNKRTSATGELWTSADMVDCILAYTASALVDKMTDPRSAEGREMLDAVKADARASKQLLLLAHL